MNGRIDGWMDEVSCLWWDSHELLGWAAGQSCGSRWWVLWAEAQATWLQGAPPSPALFPLLLLGCSANFTGLYQFCLQPHRTDQRYQKDGDHTCEWGGGLHSATRGEYPTSGSSEPGQVRSRCDIPWMGCALWAPSLLRCPLPLGCQLLLPSFTQPGVGRRGGGIWY